MPAGVLPMRKMSNNSGEGFGIIDGNYFWELLMGITFGNWSWQLLPLTQAPDSEYSWRQFLEQIETQRGVGNGRGEAQVHINRGGGRILPHSADYEKNY